MPGILLTADLHLTDNEEEDFYRWEVFEVIYQWVQDNKPCRVIIAGDLCDRKDRHSGVLVNGIVDVLTELVIAGATVAVTRGNHDTPLNGPTYWDILSKIPGITFIDEPFYGEIGIYYLPYSAYPAQDWEAGKLQSARCLIMHQTVTGVMGNNGHALINDHMPPLPLNIPIYSGDIHNPQVVEMENGAEVIYIGAPHPVKFGDTYPCRLLVLDETTFEIDSVIELHPPAKHMLDVYSLAELERAATRPGDAAKVRFFLPVSEVPNWPLTLEDVKAWASARKVRLAGVEPVLDGDNVAPAANTPEELLNLPAGLLRAFCAEEGIHGDLLETGLALLKGAEHA